ncbi:MAG: SH3 domain-containing protein [Pseudomonadota bacterium]
MASALIALCAPPLRAETGPVTGLPMPRFVSIGVEVANLRIGPRGSYEVVAIYRRRGLPLRVIDEFDTWRHVEDHEGTRGWMHQRLLSGRRVVMVLGEPQVLRRRPATEAGGILVAEPLVLARLFECEADWCFVEIDGQRGWLDRDGLWGVDP